MRDVGRNDDEIARADFGICPAVKLFPADAGTDARIHGPIGLRIGEGTARSENRMAGKDGVDLSDVLIRDWGITPRCAVK